jgi:hypothetical protein
MSSSTYREIPFDPIGKHEAIRLRLLIDTSICLHPQSNHQALPTTSTLYYLDLLIAGVGHSRRVDRPQRNQPVTTEQIKSHITEY